MKILFIYRSKSSGPSIRRVFEPIEREMGRMGIEVDSIYLPHQSISPKNIFQNYLCIKRKLKEKAYDIVHITGDVHYCLYFLGRRKSVITVHDLGFYTNYKLSPRLLFLRALLIRPLRKASMVTFISKKSLEECQRLVGIKVAQVVDNPYDDRFRFTPRQVNTQKPTILHIGTKENKNVDRVIEAQKDYPFRLHVIGRLNEAQILRLETLNIDYQNEGYVSDDDILRAYEECDIVSFPSLYEGFGMPIIEAQAVGRPVVTSNRSPMQDIAAGSAVLVNPEDVDSIRRGFYEALQRYDELVERGKENVGRFSVAHIAQQYLDLYNKVLK